MPKAQGGVGGDRPLARDDPDNAVLRHLELPCELVGADPDFAQFVAENFLTGPAPRRQNALMTFVTWSRSGAVTQKATQR